MVTKQYLDKFIKTFEHCKDLDFEWNEKLFKKSSKSSWAKLLIQRSEALRNCFEVNEENTKSLIEHLSQQLSDKEYCLLADAALQIYQDGYDDICVLPLMMEPCIEYFQKAHNLNYIIPLIHAYCFEYEQADVEDIGTPKYSYESVLDYRGEYLNISSRYARLSLFKSYSNIISRILNQDRPDCFSKMYSLYTEALSIWNKEEVQKLDGDDEEFIYFIDRMLFTITLYENISILSDEEKIIYERLIAECKEKNGDEIDPMVNCIDQALKNYEGIITNEELVDYLIQSFNEMFDKLDLNGDPNEQEDYLDNCYNTIGTMCYYMEGERNVPSKRADIIDCMNRLRLYVKTIPYTFFTSEMNRYVYLLYQKIKSFITYEEKKDYILEVIMFRQPITCIHSLMVENISRCLGDYLLKHNPELFIGVLDCRTVDEVNENKDSLLQFICDCALLHDVGKISMVDIINTQNRRLTDIEFKRIKTHPNNGLTILDNDKDFAQYFDVILGHHKWYDGSLGYPDDFDNTSSNIRIIIDIVTIADCTDAATDILGRNYTKGKTFSQVLDEFIQGKGTRYNPIIVDCIKKDNSLFDELTRLTTDSRMDIYKEVYSHYIQ